MIGEGGAGGTVPARVVIPVAVTRLAACASAGDTNTPTVINLFVFWLWEIPLAYVLAIVLGLGPRGVFLAVMIAFSTLAVVSGVIFRRGRWKTRKL